MKEINIEFVLRTMLFVPAHKSKLIENAAKTEADCLVLDLEDSCLPVSEKPKGRENIVESLKSGIFGKKKIFVRINPRNTGFMFDDLIAVTINELDGFLYPMAGSKDDIIFFDDLLNEIEMSRNIEKGKIKVFPVIETGEGIMNAFEIANASKRVVALGFGSEDFATNIQCIRDKNNESIFIPRQRIVFAARSAGTIPIDTPHVDVHNIDGLEKHVSQARTLGFGGMQILHPKEIDICHKYYSPSEEEAQESYKIIELFQKAQDEGSGVAILEGRFISPPTYKRAIKTVENYERIKKYGSQGE
jgi:citrate lyase subunit beta / citryl-CoA lyase